MRSCLFCSASFKPLRSHYQCCSTLCSKQKWARDNHDNKLLSQSNYRKNNLSKMAAKEAVNRARRNRAMPPWIDIKDFIPIYTKARQLGLVVDHIIPIKHDKICGLHVPWNLQLLSQSANSIKSNKMEIS